MGDKHPIPCRIWSQTMGPFDVAGNSDDAESAMPVRVTDRDWAASPRTARRAPLMHLRTQRRVWQNSPASPPCKHVPADCRLCCAADGVPR